MLASSLHAFACQSVCAHRGKTHSFTYVAEPILKYALLHIAQGRLKSLHVACCLLA